MYRLRIWLIASVLLPIMSISVVAQNLAATVVLPVHGQLVFIDIAENNLFLTDAFTGESRSLVSVEPPIQSPFWSPEGNQLAFVTGPRGDRHNLILDVTTGTSQPLPSVTGLTTPIGWSLDASNILYRNYDINSTTYNEVHTFNQLDVLSGEVTTRGVLTSGQVLSVLPFPPGAGEFILFDIFQISRNPVYNDWIAVRATGLNNQIIPDLATHTGDFPDEAWLHDVVLWNFQTGQMLSLAALFPDEVDTSSPIAWSQDGAELMAYTYGNVNGYAANIVRLNNTGGNWSLEPIATGRTGRQLAVHWLGVTDLLIAMSIDELTNDTLFHIAEIINGTWYSTEFLRIPDETFGSINSGDWHLTATEEEKHALSCLFDQAMPARISPGTRARVNFTDGTALRLRAEPDFDAAELMQMPEGTEFEVIGGPACVNAADYYRFWELRLDDGTTGWAAEADTSDYFIEAPGG